jgi:hypothetical protein
MMVLKEIKRVPPCDVLKKCKFRQFSGYPESGFYVIADRTVIRYFNTITEIGLGRGAIP